MKRITLALLSIITLTFMACQDDETATDTTLDAEVAMADLSTEESYDYVNEDVDDLVEAGINFEGSTGGRVEFGVRDRILKCAEVEHDTATNTITITYDSLSDCQNPFGHVRQGTIIITYSDRRYVPGATRTITFQDFYIDDVKVEGTRTLENIQETSEDAPKFRITLVGGKLTFDDGTTITRDSERIRTWYRADNPLDDEVTVEGSASGTRRDGSAYEIEILEPLVYVRDCRESNQSKIPVSGIKQITSGENVITIDFGDGTCDNLVDVTVNGVTETKEISPRGFRRK